MLPFARSLVVLASLVAASGLGVYSLVALVSTAHVIPRSADDLRLLSAVWLVIASWAVIVAAREEVAVRRRGSRETAEALSDSRPS